MDQEKSELLVVRLPLTDEQIKAFVMGAECGNTPDETVRAIGTPVPDSGLETVGYIPSGDVWQHSGPLPMRNIYQRHAEAWPDPVVRRFEAEAVIAGKDREIADLKSVAETVISFDEAYRRKVERRVLPAAMGDMMKITDLIEWAQKIRDQFGNTCVYAVDLSWGAVALNREADDRKRLSPEKTSWTDNPDFEGADAEAAFAALLEENAILTARLEAPERDGLKAHMFWDNEEGENGANRADIVMESYDPFEPVEMQTGFFGPNIWGFHDGTNSFVFATEAECHASIDAALGREGRGNG